MTKKSISAIVVFLVFSASTPSATAEDTYIEATETTWGEITSDDGFSKSFTIFKESSNVGISDYGDDIEYSIEIQCEQKELTVLVYADPIGIYPTNDFNRVGYGLVKIDSGKIVKYKYVALKDSSGVNFWSSKLLTSNMLKGKRQVAFKIPSSVQNDTVANFQIGNLASYSSRFKSLGCPLK